MEKKTPKEIEMTTTRSITKTGPGQDTFIPSSDPVVISAIIASHKLFTFKPKKSASPDYYIKEVLPELKKSNVVGLVVMDGGCLQPILSSKLIEYQRLRCRVAFHALHFRPEILALAHLMVKRLRASGQPYLAYHPGLVRDSLAHQGCAELFQWKKKRMRRLKRKRRKMRQRSK
ncbi:GDP-fucose protein O-fucosyltransferase [Artemisia annua]|uniref:O-fucosyltransferase family protein n=1 Tax=Artemisia annua TaxID=35608 RepID=A0A2U1PL55_ARTAN|nr:GDP-fucose protein O-fucosyltransferase [Artemisia annua]